MLPSSSVELVIEVVYAEAHRGIARVYRLVAPASIEDALLRAAADEAFAGIDLFNVPVGVFGKVATRAETLRDGDRVEIYRPLAADPKVARRNRARSERYRTGRGAP